MTTFIIILLLIIIIFVYIKRGHYHIDFKSFRKKGFKKLDNAFGISCYTGKQGTGKTYSSIKFVIEQMDKFNYKVITNIKSLADRNGGVTLVDYQTMNEDKRNVIQFIYCADIFDIINFCKEFRENEKNILIFYDEIFTCLEKSGSLQREILSFLSQLRKRKILFITTAQEWAEINITFRRYIRFQISCNMIALPFSKKAIVINNINDGDLIHWDETEQDFIAPTIQINISKGLKEIIDLYDTFETIDSTSILNKRKY